MPAEPAIAGGGGATTAETAGVDAVTDAFIGQPVPGRRGRPPKQQAKAAVCSVFETDTAGQRVADVDPLEAAVGPAPAEEDALIAEMAYPVSAGEGSDAPASDAGPDGSGAAPLPDVPAQRCTVHKHRNPAETLVSADLAHAPDALREEVSADHTDMTYAATAKEVQARRKAFLRKWRLRCPWARSSLTPPLLTSPPRPTNYRPAGDTPLKQLPHKSRQHPAETAPTQRDRHLQHIAEHGRMTWQKRPGYNKRASRSRRRPVETGGRRWAVHAYGRAPRDRGGGRRPRAQPYAGAWTPELHPRRVLIPSRPSTLDIETLYEFCDVVEGEKRPMTFVLNALKPKTRISSDAIRGLSGFGTVAPTELADRVDYSGSFNDGRSAGKLAPGGKADREISELWNYVTARLRKYAKTTDRERAA